MSAAGLPTSGACSSCGGSTVPAMVKLCVACGEVDDVLTLFAEGIDPRFTASQLEGMDETRATLIGTLGVDRFDQAVAVLRDRLAAKAIRPDELFAYLIGASELVKVLEEYGPDLPEDVDANSFAFGVIAALVRERLPR